ncbi:hypothetical protein HZS_170 [Henneguya salminicola]|nr:hypothetical protein HZS_170 [Henneguya salminicola]
MAFDASYNLTIPCGWCLPTGKNEHIYCEILHNIFILLNYDWMPLICVIDSEMALLKAVKYQFTETTIIGCNFHLRYALLRKTQKYGIPAAERNSCMQFIGVLSVIPIDELEIGLAYIQQNTLQESKKWPFFGPILREYG